MKTMLGGTVRFMKGVRGSKLWIKIWLMILMGLLMGAPIYFWELPEARAIFTMMMMSAGFMMWLTGRFGFSRILGLGHILFIPLAGCLIASFSRYPAQSPAGIYLRLAAGAILVSLLFDIADVIRYLSGEREETVKTS